jgi:hypothetical protein
MFGRSGFVIDKPTPDTDNAIVTMTLKKGGSGWQITDWARADR